MARYEILCIDRIFLNSANLISRKEIPIEENLTDFTFESCCSL